MKRAISGLLCLMLSSLRAQMPQIASNNLDVNIQLNQMGIDESSKSSMSVVPLFKVVNNRVEEYLDLVGADLNDASIATAEIIPPNQFKSTLSYGYFFQQHDNQNWEPNRLLFVIEGGSNWHQWPMVRIWLDRNHNLDFTDEIPDTLFLGKSRQMLPFFLGNRFTSGIHVSKFPSSQFYRFSQMNDLSIREMCGSRLFLGTENSLKIERINILYTKVKFGTDTLVTGIIDANSNGSFGDLGIDRWLIAKHSDSVISTQNSQLLNKHIHFNWMGFAYDAEIPEIFVETLKLRSSTDKKARSKSLLIGSKMPKFKFCVAQKNAKRRSSKTLPEKPCVLVIWSAENKEFLRDTALLHHKIRTSQDSITWVFLNAGGSGKYVGYYNRRYSIQTIQGFANSKITNCLKLQHLPQYLFFDRKKVLRYNGTNLNDLFEVL